MVEASDAPMTPYFRFVSDFCRRHPHITAAEAAAAGHLVPPEVRDYRVMSYDRLFGERFSVVRRGEVGFARIAGPRFIQTFYYF